MDAIFAMGRHTSETDWIFTNDGKGGFYGRRALNENPDPSYGVVLGDVDRDGDLDAMIVNDAGTRSTIYTNDGRGQFLMAVRLGATGHVHRRRAGALADLDRDGDLDAILVGADQDHVYFNEGLSRPWRETPLGTRPQPGARATGVAAADVNGDGALDIVVPGRAGAQGVVHLNDGKGTFVASLALGEPTADATSVAVGDVDGDGDLDIVTANWQQSHTVYLNDRNGAFSVAGKFGTGKEQSWSILLGDMDLDGDLDAVVGNADVGFWEEDFDGDGRADRFGQQALGMPSRIYLNDGKGQFTAGSVLTTGSNDTRPIALGDLDSDGDLDVLMGNDCQGNYVFFNPVRTWQKQPRD